MRKIILALAFALFAIPAAIRPAEAAPDKVALVIGMGDYAHVTPLDNTVNDAKGVADTLKSIGFDVTLALDTPGSDLRRMLEDFAFYSETADLALIYYAGHGVEVSGENFLIPVDADIASNLDIQRQGVSLTQLLQVIDHARRMRLIILDSCRNSPFGGVIDTTAKAGTAPPVEQTGTRGSGGGLAAPSPDRGTLVAFAAKDGEVALDSVPGSKHSPYAQALIDKLPQPGLEISLMFRQVRDEVQKVTNFRQEPYTYGSLSGVPFYIAGGATKMGYDANSPDPVLAWASLTPDQEPAVEALAEAGDTRSLLGLAYIRLNPNKADRYNPAEAAEFLKRAAEAGAPDAQWELARLYEKGLIGTAPDEAKALDLYRKSAEAGYAKALNDMGFFYFQGSMGLAKDPVLALDFFRRAADQRHPEAQYNYAALIDDGLVPGKGPADAARYLYEALRSGNESVLQVMSQHSDTFKIETRKALQEELKRYGFYAGSIDGDIGPGSIKAIRIAFGKEA